MPRLALGGFTSFPLREAARLFGELGNDVKRQEKADAGDLLLKEAAAAMVRAKHNGLHTVGIEMATRKVA